MTDQRVAVVTGGNRGMGLETCRQLAERGMCVVLASRDLAKGQAAAAGLTKDGTVVAQQLDVTDDKSVAALARFVDETYGRLDVLVNNAGVMLDAGSKSLFDAAPGAILKSFEVNALGAVRVCQALVPMMLKNGYGRIVNVSSGMGQLSEMNHGAPGYRMSKTALNALTKLLSEELKDRGIKVNAVCPGHVKTELGGPGATRSIEEGVDTTVWLATLREDGPTGRFFRDYKVIDW